MALESNRVEGLEVAVSWTGIDPEDWRDRLDPDGDVGNEDDDDQDWPKELSQVLGFDPSLLSWS